MVDYEVPYTEEDSKEQQTEQPEEQPETKEDDKKSFTSLLNRGGGLSAMLWAEKVRQSLEKAEQKKPIGVHKPTEDFVNGLGRISFFSGGFKPSNQST